MFIDLAKKVCKEDPEAIKKLSRIRNLVWKENIMQENGLDEKEFKNLNKKTKKQNGKKIKNTAQKNVKKTKKKKKKKTSKIRMAQRHHGRMKKKKKYISVKTPPAGIEPATPRFRILCSAV
jgi:hypothetical protein